MLARDAAALTRFLQSDVDGFHTSAFNGWAHEAPRALWALLKGALSMAVRRAGGMAAMDPKQAAIVQALLDGGLEGIYDGRAPLSGTPLSGTPQRSTPLSGTPQRSTPLSGTPPPQGSTPPRRPAMRPAAADEEGTWASCDTRLL